MKFGYVTQIESGDGVAALLSNLAGFALDPSFEEYGNFVQVEPKRAIAGARYGEWVDGPDLCYPNIPGAVQFFGNFFAVSAVFRITTNDPAVIEPLTQAIRANQSTPAYLEARGRRTMTLKSLKAAARAVGATVEDDGNGGELRYQVVAPPGKVWVESDSEHLVVSARAGRREWLSDAIRDGIDRMNSGLRVGEPQ